MSRVLFVDPDSVTLPLWDDGVFWVRVKKELNAGEARQLAQSALTRMSQAGTPDAPLVAFDISPEAGAFAKVLIYLLDWNLSDKSGKTVPIETLKAKRDALKALHPDVFAEIERVIDAHAASNLKKTMPGAASAPSSTS